jgi:hypothetical protein
MVAVKRRKLRRIIFILSGVLLFFIAVVFFLANFYVEPVLRKRIDTLVVEGSDSLYSYTLADLHINFLGGNIGVHDLQIRLDSTKYNQLKSRGKLPALTMQINVNRAHIKGLGIFALLFNKKIVIDEISSEDADIRINRYLHQKDTTKEEKETPPLWKAIRPRLKDVVVHKIRLDGIRLLYKNEEGDEGKLQFDRCDALFENIRIDSTSVLDTSRIGYVKNFSFKLNDLKFRTTDSTYKLKAEWITYNSQKQLLEVDSFKIQPTVRVADRDDSLRKSWYTVTLDKVSFMGLRLDRYLRLNRAEADSVIFQKPVLAVYQDMSALKTYQSKIGKYPHQLLVNARAIIDIKKFIARDMAVAVTEKHEVTGEEGTINLSDINLSVANIVNDPVRIRQNGVSRAEAEGKIIGSPIKASFLFYLDSAGGRFDVKGRIGQTTAAQINPISSRMANIEVPSVNISSIDFFVRGQDYEATADVQMVYNNLSIIFRKRDMEKGTNTTRKFLTNLLNRYAINPSNNGERVATKVRAPRLTTQSFFGIIWRAVFEGMQQIMLKMG